MAAFLLCVGTLGIVCLSWPSLLTGVAAFLLFIPSLSVVGIPANEVGVAIIIGVAFLHRGRKMHIPSSLLALCLLAFAWITSVAVVESTGASGARRWLHLILWLAVILAGATGRIPWRALAMGVFAAFGVALALTVLTVGPYVDSYSGRATALVGDPNALAASVAILTPIVYAQLRRQWARVLLFVTSASLVVATLSRTGLIAWMAALAIYALIPRFRALTVTVVAAGVAFAIVTPGRSLGATWFGDRAGSDELRERIKQASTESAESSPWTGHGLGTAKVQLPEGTFFFHNSYYAVVNEIGIIGAAVVGAIVLVGLIRGCVTPLGRAGAAGIAGGLVMAAQLGEVVLDLPIAIAAGIAWSSAANVETPARGSSAEGMSAHRVDVEHLA